MKKFITSIAALLTTVVLFSKTAREVTATSGNYDTNSRVKVSWTLGEAVIETFSNANNTLTQGFQQPDGSCPYDDREAPEITCPDNIDIGCASIVAWAPPVVTDNCSIREITSDYASGTFIPVGATVVTYTAVDNAGFSTQCSFTVTRHSTPTADGGASVTINSLSLIHI